MTIDNGQLTIFEVGSITVAPDVSVIRNAVPPVLRTHRLKTTVFQRNRRERPMCRSARERTELFPAKNRNVPPLCHSDRSASGVEESTTEEKVPTQGKICYLGSFLGSLRSLGMSGRGGGFVLSTGVVIATQPNGTQAVSYILSRTDRNVQRRSLQ